MGYYEQSLLARDYDFQMRIAACASDEVPDQEPTSWAVKHQWQIAASPGFAEAYDYALDTGVENPGRDETVITDAQLLSAVQAVIAPEST